MSDDGAGRRAVFFDRDGTLIDDVHYIADPTKVVLRPGAAGAVRRINQAGWLAIVVTNQSGIARGMLTEDDYRRVEARVGELLGTGGARLDASYFCPHLPEVTGPCACRKPGTALYERAAAEHGIDLARSAYVGDKLRDVEPARRLGGLGVLVPSRDTKWLDQQRARDEFTLNTTLDAAVDRVLAWRGSAS
ncbi:histidinol-phosphate phosphatase family protein [Gemmatirosa kalamazoonensis]|uniref:D,D-heptose 1,7-bisphosphate phosphatase n=1 Tax=Gemmatirosa kalamazoonensis TaxID=861299 RepID=W0RM63_9BACT|nr:HAD family hydrolase [Gemmatirosa kalamazoonensis]AHG90528.1 histidinol-phosphate phosphatase family protein [Gemmatirosa kalamazoonensis]